MASWAELKETRPERPRRQDGTYLPRHGRKHTPLYSVWTGILTRCSDENGEKFHIYGGRGISFTPEWRTFEPFENWALANGYRKGLQIDRIDVDGNYAPENCRFVSCKENNNNRRNNRLISAFGETKTVARWSEDPRCVVDVFTLYKRVRYVSPELAMTIPKRPGSSLIKRGARIAY